MKNNAGAKGRSGEDFVNRIAFKSFLKYWCFPGPNDILKDNKEICDLLVVFGHVCIIISVKNYAFNGNYERYFKKTVEKAIRQIDGAERKLFRDEPVLLQHPDRKPEVFEKDKISQVHRIVINLNEHIKYYQTSYFKEDKNYIVMDAAAWYTSMEELNTLPDLAAYLTARCKLFSSFPAFIFPRSEFDISTNDKISAQADMEVAALAAKGLSIISGSELDLIAQYLMHGFKFPSNLNHDQADIMLLKLDGEWEKFVSSKLSAKKDDYEKESYFIDRLVKHFLIDIENGNHLAMLFFRLNRFERAEFARTFLDYHERYAMGDIKVRLNRSHVVLPFIHMVFLYFEDDYPKDGITDIVNMSLHHHHYLHHFKCGEVGALGMSRSGEFVFGYSKVIEPYTDIEIGHMRENFRTLGWQTEQL
jgi:hypothetical protein